MQEQGRFKPYIDNVNVYQYHEVDSFQAALADGSPNRVFMGPKTDWFGHKHALGFVAQDRSVHTYNYDPQTASTPDIPVFEALRELKDRKLVSCEIIVSTRDRVGQVYQIFRPEFPYGFGQDDATRIDEENFRDWLEASRETQELNLKKMETLLYYRNPKTLAVDFSVGDFHLVTVLGLFKNYTLEDLKKAFPKTRIQDNTEVVDWGKVAATDIDPRSL